MLKILPIEFLGAQQQFCPRTPCGIGGPNCWDRSKRLASEAALSGIIRCGHCNCRMTPIKSKRWGRVYNYYRCSKDVNRDVPICPVKEVSAGDIEKLVCEQIDPILKSPEVVAAVAQQTGLRPKTITALLGDGFWEELTPLEKQRLMQLQD